MIAGRQLNILPALGAIHLGLLCQFHLDMCSMTFLTQYIQHFPEVPSTLVLQYLHSSELSCLLSLSVSFLFSVACNLRTTPVEALLFNFHR